MEDDDRELLRRLFAAATELIETAHDAAIAGQSGEIAAPDYVAQAHRLQALARNLAKLAGAAIVIANPGENSAEAGPNLPH